MKRILFVINTLGTAGAEKALIELLKRLDTPDYEVSLFVLMNQGELLPEIPPHVRVLNKNYDNCTVNGAAGSKHLKKHVIRTLLKRGTVIRCFPYMIGNALAMKKNGGLRADKLLWREMAMGAPRFEGHYDLAVAYIEGGAAYYVRDYVDAEKKAAFIHIDYQKAGYTRKLDRDCYLAYDRIFPVSDEVRSVFLNVYPEMEDKTFVFHNLIDPQGIRRKAQEEGGFEDDFDGIRILTIGRLAAQKSFETSIDAMAILKERGIRARWYVLGTGDREQALREHIAEGNLQEDFLLLGNRANPYPYLKQCDLYVHASGFEGKSIAIKEARIMGCPVLVTDCSGNREQVEDGVDGRLCDFNAAAIAEGIAGMLEDREKTMAMGREAARRMDEELKEQKIDKLTDLLR